MWADHEESVHLGLQLCLVVRREVEVLEGLAQQEVAVPLLHGGDNAHIAWLPPTAVVWRHEDDPYARRLQQADMACELGLWQARGAVQYEKHWVMKGDRDSLFYE